MKVLIIEDEVLAAERLEKLLSEADPGIKVLARLVSVRDSVKWLRENSADLIFLDIQLSDGISFSIFDEVAVSTPVIFVTAYDEYALKAFRLNSISYLLKPVRKEDLAMSLQKYNSLRSAFSIDFDSLISAIKGRQPDYRRRFLIQVGDKYRKIDIADVAWFSAVEKNVFLTTTAGISYPVDMTLETLEEVIDPMLFFRINRKYIIGIQSIEKMIAWSRSRIKLTIKPTPGNDDDIIVSIDRAADFRKWLNR